MEYTFETWKELITDEVYDIFVKNYNKYSCCNQTEEQYFYENIKYWVKFIRI